jgi:two-component system response regulator BaeR
MMKGKQTVLIVVLIVDDEASIIRGLNIGADDYVCRPFSPRQLIVRVVSEYH